MRIETPDTLRRIAGAGAMLAAAIVVAVPALPEPADARTVPGSFADLAEELSPAVVNISTSQSVERPENGGPQVPPGSPFEDLFRDFFDQGQPRQPREVQSLGSGFVISAEGYIVTNNHVIDGADEITANFIDGTSLEAELIGTDPKTDLAVLKVEPDEPLDFVTFGDSDAARVGDWVLAIGNPFGLGGSVSAGIISARNRDINAGPYDDFLQTDAAINRGNSGGPLFNMDGDVIGVNTAIISPTGGSIGIGFAVPAAIAESVVAQLREFGQTRRGWLGVRIQTVNDELAEALGLEEATGALVADVTRDGPAEEAGIQAGDVILKFDGQDVEEMRDLPRIVADTEVGSKVRVVVFRKGKTQSVLVEIGLLEEASAAGVAPAGGDDGDADEAPERTELGELGLTLGTLTGSAREEFSVPENVDGVLVMDVDPEGPAAEEGISRGHVVVEVAQEPVSTPQDVLDRVAEVKESGRKAVLFLIHAGGDLRFVPVSFPD